MEGSRDSSGSSIKPALGFVSSDSGFSHEYRNADTVPRLLQSLAGALVGYARGLCHDAPRPILIHCRSGADRTGLASVVYLARVAHADEETAERQLSIRYGHFAVPFFSSAYAMDESWEDMEAAARSAG